jgi:hypothetical protein
MNNVLEIGVARKGLADVVLQEVETGIVLVLQKALFCTLTIAPQGIDMAFAMLHEHIRQATSYQTSSTRDENISRQR